MRLALLLAATTLTACGPGDPPADAAAVEKRAIEAQTAKRRTGAELQDRAENRIVSSEYVCADGSHLTVTFDNPRQMATVRMADATAVDLRQERAASGLWYRSDTHELRGQGREATWTAGSVKPTTCRAVS
ncbi:MAG TPA: MliC family protein [Caulobacteraceae bacterium]|jgi:membrane-bound inhibitor of C-type lysozyme